MAERLNNPEEKLPPVMIECGNCETQYELDPQNTVAFEFTKQDCQHIVTLCPDCNSKTRMFCEPATIEELNKRGIEIFEHDWAPDEIYQQWLQVNEIELPTEYELTDRHEKIIQKFGEVLRNMPDDFFWDNIELDTNRPYPERWT